MAISGNYNAPVSVNGYQCWNCTDVDNAKKNIDPQHPKAGPYGIDAATDPTLRNKAIVFGGGLSGLSAASSGVAEQPDIGAALDITA